jgi:FAD/FMN-containing dehydrogenase
LAFLVTRSDPRYLAVRAGHNLRWPAHEADGADRIFLCQTGEDAAVTLQKIVAAGQRPTVRSGGHCYEDFVANNPHGAILDMSALSQVMRDPGTGVFHIGTGAQLWPAYQSLYKQHGVTLPGGSCGTVGAGGHISGGGYGALSRLMGLTSDLLTAVSILTIDKHGKVLPIRATADHHPDLFRACRGAGAASFGLVTDFEFAALPIAPREVTEAKLSFAWDGMTQEKLADILMTFGRYFQTRGQEQDTWGLYAVLSATHKSSGTISLDTQFCNEDGTCHDLRPQLEFLNLFAKWSVEAGQGDVNEAALKRNNWLSVTGAKSGAPLSRRGKYKSTLMRRGFTLSESQSIFRHLSTELPETNLKEALVEIHGYGGAINRPELAETTAVAQRGSVLKLQFITYWDDASQDAKQTGWMDNFYTELYSGPDADPKCAGTPYWNDHYQGCYINYPDMDMLRYDFWPQLYYGQINYAFLQQVKRRYDPNNVFHNAMSVRV